MATDNYNKKAAGTGRMPKRGVIKAQIYACLVETVASAASKAGELALGVIIIKKGGGGDGRGDGGGGSTSTSSPGSAYQSDG